MHSDEIVSPVFHSGNVATGGVKEFLENGFFAAISVSINGVEVSKDVFVSLSCKLNLSEENRIQPVQ